MCGRYSLTFIFEGLAEIFNAIIDAREAVPPRYNAAPTQMLPVITQVKGQNYLQVMRWGLVPAWAQDTSQGARMINARLETVKEKPAYKLALFSRRCLVPADGYYEWQPSAAKSNKQPYRITTAERPVFAFAGLWEEWADNNSRLQTFTIITTAANDQVAGIHDRMPIILPREQEEYWLKGPGPGQGMHDFLTAIRPEVHLNTYRVSPLVNSPRNDVPECLLPLEA